jgi:hypothetical protein
MRPSWQGGKLSAPARGPQFVRQRGKHVAIRADRTHTQPTNCCDGRTTRHPPNRPHGWRLWWPATLSVGRTARNTAPGLTVSMRFRLAPRGSAQSLRQLATLSVTLQPCLQVSMSTCPQSIWPARRPPAVRTARATACAQGKQSPPAAFLTPAVVSTPWGTLTASMSASKLTGWCANPRAARSGARSSSVLRRRHPRHTVVQLHVTETGLVRHTQNETGFRSGLTLSQDKSRPQRTGTGRTSGKSTQNETGFTGRESGRSYANRCRN